MYLGDPRERQIDLDNNTVWEEDGRTEARYVWHGRVLDLCDLPPEDYAKTVFHTQEVDQGLISNPFVVSIDGNNCVIEFPYPPTTSIVMIIKDSDANEDVITISKGSTSPQTYTLMNVDSSKVLTILIGDSYSTATSPTFSDETYKYSVVKKIVAKDQVKFVLSGILHTTVEGGLSPEILKPMLTDAVVSGNSCTFSYLIYPEDEYGLTDKTDAEIKAVLEQHNMDLLILSITDVEKIYLNETDDQTSEWVYYGSLTIDGLVYKIYRWVSTLGPFCNVHDSKYEPGPFTADEYKYKITVQ